MITLHVPEISSTAGDLSDGIFVGKINQVNPTAVLLGETLVTISQVLRKAVTATGATWQDFTTEATNATAGDFAPFGTASDMSSGDAFYIRTTNDVDTHSIYAQISTPMDIASNTNMDYYEQIIYTTVQIAADIDKLNGYLAHKYSLTANLAGGHTYKTLPPLVSLATY